MFRSKCLIVDDNYYRLYKIFLEGCLLSQCFKVISVRVTQFQIQERNTRVRAKKKKCNEWLSNGHEWSFCSVHNASAPLVTWQILFIHYYTFIIHFEWANVSGLRQRKENLTSHEIVVKTGKVEASLPLNAEWNQSKYNAFLSRTPLGDETIMDNKWPTSHHNGQGKIKGRITRKFRACAIVNKSVLH